MRQLTAALATILVLTVQAATAQSPFSGSLIGAADDAGSRMRQTGGGRVLSGSALTQQSERLPGVTVVARIHGMPGHSRAVTAGFTSHILGKE